MYSNFYPFIILFLGLLSINTDAQITERSRPEIWNDLAFGGRFMDRFLPMPAQGPLTENTWGANYVKPRYIENGLEDDEWSYWGGNALLGEDGMYHLFVCRWREDAEKGHMAWPNSQVVHAVAENSFGPYQVKTTIGQGHNPEIFRIHDGRYVIYVYKGYYISDNLDGPWVYSQFTFEVRDRKIIEGLSNLSFAQREDGSYIMVCRGGGIWFSKTGISPYHQVTEQRVYPPVDGRFEDPLIWRTNIQYHMIVNDWLGRIAYYLRSKDGVNWKIDPGEAYMPGIARYTDGTQVDWFKYERIKVLQDKYGRATQAHFAVIDTIKWNDLKNDHHSSKHICIPLSVGRLISLEDSTKIDDSTKLIRLRIKAEEGFNPHQDVDISSLRFGAPEKVNFGNGCKVKSSSKSGKDLIITFEGAGNGLNEENFSAKLVGKTTEGNLLFGYTRLPWIEYLEPVLSARLPRINKKGVNLSLNVEVHNFGQVKSQETQINIEVKINHQWTPLAKGTIPSLDPFEKSELELPAKTKLSTGTTLEVKVTILDHPLKPTLLHGQVSVG